ncbi:MAG: hypothetical protein ACRCZF_18170, partial [Gemmataceae bacterium]
STVLSQLGQGMGQSPPLLATVREEPVELVRKGKTDLCWVIDYRSDRAEARTWVSVADSRVLQQEATTQGETLRLTRED